MILLFDIIFQSGEFYGDTGFSWTEIIPDVAGNLIGGFIGAGSAIWLYYRSVKKDKEKEIERQFAFEKDKLKYLNLLVTNSIKLIDYLIKGLDEFCQSVSQDSITFPILTSHSLHNLERIVNRINQEEHYHAYLNQIKDNKIGEIFEIVDYFYDSYKLLYDSLEKRQLYDYEQKKRFGDAVTDIAKVTSKGLYLLKKNNQQETEIFKQLNTVLLAYQQELKVNPSNFTRLQETLIKPILIIYLKFRYENLPFNFDEIGDKASEANKMLSPIKLNNLNALERVKSYSDDFKENLKKLHDFSKPLNDYLA